MSLSNAHNVRTAADDPPPVSRKRRRGPGEIPYPLEYNRNLVDYDNFDWMFMYKLSGAMTMHQFTTPPKLILDLGCGGGLWCIEAAKKWPQSHIIGLDMKDVQPKLENLDDTPFASVIKRVKWVHANLRAPLPTVTNVAHVLCSLDRLPFASDHFDMVRTQNIGLGVPEDEWPSVIEEIYRVLKPGGVLEMIEEDYMFPSGNLPKAPISITSAPLLPPPLHFKDGGSSLSFGSDISFVSESIGRSGAHSTPDSATSSGASRLTNGLELSRSRSPPRIEWDIPLYAPEPPHPQDHTKLKEAWEAMLHSRFISSQPLSILPLYLGNFVDIKPLPLVDVPLPPTSSVDKPYSPIPPLPQTFRSSRESVLIDRRSSERQVIEVKEFNKNIIEQWAPILLARTVQVIVECKPAIWEKFLEQNNPNPDLVPTKQVERSVREDFDHLFDRWLSDMNDRIGSRPLLMQQLAWTEPEVGDQPDWRTWRNALPEAEDAEPSSEQELCRSMRAFVGWKPKERVQPHV